MRVRSATLGFAISPYSGRKRDDLLVFLRKPFTLQHSPTEMRNCKLTRRAKREPQVW
jgi:hypothetical protein